MYSPDRLSLDDKCCGGDDAKRITYLAIPFALSPTKTSHGETAFLEPRREATAGVTLLLGTLVALAVLALPPLVLLLWSRQWMAFALVLVVAVMLIVIATSIRRKARRLKHTARRLIFHNPSLSLAIQVVGRDGSVESEIRAGIGECTLSYHPVRLSSAMGIWLNYWMARVKIGDRCFTLACLKREEDLLAYMQRLPQWLLAISTGEGERVEAMLSDRKFGAG